MRVLRLSSAGDRVHTLVIRGGIFSIPKGTDQGIKAFFTSSTVVSKTTGATCSSTDAVLQKEKARVESHLKRFVWTGWTRSLGCVKKRRVFIV